MKKIFFALAILFYFPMTVLAGIDYSGLIVTSPKVKILYSTLDQDLQHPDPKILSRMMEQACQEKIKQLQSEGKEVLGYEIRQESLYWKDTYANCNILVLVPQETGGF